MNIAVFSAKSYDREYLGSANTLARHTITFWDTRLMADTVPLAKGCEVVCAFVNDRLDAEVIAMLAVEGTRLIAMRCAGYNNVDLYAAAAHGVTVVNVPSYSPHAVAEHAIALLLTLNRRIHQAHDRVRRGDFTLDGLIGFDLNGKTAGQIGRAHV